jgi:hypothetical protein
MSTWRRKTESYEAACPRLEGLCDAFRSVLASGGVKNDSASGQESESECTRGTLGKETPQGKDNKILFPAESSRRGTSIRCHHRLGGLLKYYERAA